jgi:hypothetical protein
VDQLRRQQRQMSRGFPSLEAGNDLDDLKPVDVE